MPLNQLVFVRDGESVHHVTGMTGGWTNFPLTDPGLRQAQATAGHLATFAKGWPVSSSDLSRAAETAAAIGQSLANTPVHEPLLRENNNGAATGLSAEAAQAIAKPAPLQFAPDWTAFGDGESYAVIADRMSRALARIEAQAANRAVGVRHGFSGALLIKAWLGITGATGLSLRLEPASLSEMCINEWGERQLTRLNATFGSN